MLQRCYLRPTQTFKHVGSCLQTLTFLAHLQFLGDDQATPDVKVRIYTPGDAGSEPLPLVVFYHGGGWKAGTIDTEDHLFRTVCGQVRCIVVSVGYRLWPEHDFVTMNNDCYDAFQWVSEIFSAARVESD